MTLNVASAPPPGTAPVGAWGFDEATGPSVVDASGRGNNGTIAGATRTTSGRFGSALTFDGVNDWVTVPDSASLDLSNRATLEAWVNPTALGSAWRTVLLKEQPGQLVYALYANNDIARPSGHLFTTGDLFSSGNAALPLNTWSHLAMTWDGATLRLFVGGNQVATRDADRHARQQHRRPALWRQRRSGRSGSRAGSTRSASTTGRSRRQSSRPT